MAKTTNRSRIEGASNPNASWAKDGKRIAFGYFNGEKSSVKIMDADGVSLKTFAEGGRVSLRP
ncbi:MAG: hypothetical protein EXS09_18815 [Gemmataceae bacterium]|nr:hypothetical protein [Gemmataceae bacterium]